MSASPSEKSSSRSSRPLACVLCQRRKVKCDRKYPCANCIKSKATCSPSIPAPIRKRRRPNAELQARLARCEELLAKYAAASKEPLDHTSTAPPTQAATIPLYENSQMNWKPAGKLVVEDGSVRFMDNFLWATVYEELRGMRELVDDAEEVDDTEPPQDWDSGASMPDYSQYLLVGGNPVDEEHADDLYPNPSQIFRLWQTFLERVNSLTKIVHAPTMQPFVVEAAGGPGKVPHNVEALLFSIYSMAVVSMTDEESLSLLGSTCNAAFQRFSTGVRRSLFRAEFLRSHDLTTLQALVLHIMSIQGRCNIHGAWVLNGICVRIAQKMGLHRDGELLGLPPFETEMRRRIWWQIFMLDIKFSMISGLSQSLLPRPSDCKLPKNLNDADLHTGATERYQDREGPTEMVMPLLVYQIGYCIQQQPDIEALMLYNELSTLSSGRKSKVQSAQITSLVKTIQDRLSNVVEKNSDPSAGPVHEFAALIKSLILQKVKETTCPPQEQPEWGTEILTPKDNLFKWSVMTTEQTMNAYKSNKHPGFHWFIKLIFQYDVVIYMVGQLGQRTAGALVERAWQQLPAIYEYHPEFLDPSQEYNMALAKFVLKAWKVRDDYLSSQHGVQPDEPAYVARVREKMAHYMSRSRSGTAQPSNRHMHSPATENHEGHSSMDQLFSRYLGAGTSSWDPLAMPDQEIINRQLASFEGLDMRTPNAW
ncbi:fungal specific transcription factor domain-containing protein (C6 zinc finger protein) [Colletotrichum plurivorum]|uniref:Fungal specific transcription factor domain-containing protein (C6 zinc finger protein) n=1 Tax=Colletotrichum plurivorum TaxID=2175906 RepID=A0A8H6KN30_9PEZI|nr:fungal specific transcription factor domain-containing protein (C6 zinc finger protein) [Colletotrichum plurivorum]